ncbi:MAG: substrate-binding domain-containing protein [Treponema sp.]|nr:substrate-binding domain-containing protein [Treponema sp.]
MPYTANVVVLDENDNEGMVATRINFEQKPLGFIFLGGSPKKLSGDFEKVHIPSVLISNQAESLGSAYISSVSIDNMKASFTSAEFLLKNGHRKIGVIGGALDSEISSTRYEGFLSALISAGVHFDFDHSYEIAKYSFEGGALAAKRLIEKNPDITAVFTMSDAMAIGACRAFRDLGYKVPENISVIGFDGLAISDYLCPRLTTIRQIEEELACEGLNVLLDSIENKASCCHKIVPFEFIEGESVKKID